MNEAQKGFEAWLESEFGMWAIQPEPGVYGSEKIQNMWKAWQAALQSSQTAPAVPDGVDVTAFGSGDYTVEVGGYADQHAVFIAPANPAGKVGDLAQPTTGEDKHRLVPGERVMTFPTEVQAFAVAEALAGRRINRLNGSSPTPQPDHSPDAGKVVQDSPAGWIWDAYGSRNFTAGTHHKDVLEADGVTLTPVYTHPAESREEIQALALEKFADDMKAKSDGAMTVRLATIADWTETYARTEAARLRASQQECQHVWHAVPEIQGQHSGPMKAVCAKCGDDPNSQQEGGEGHE